MGTHRTRHRHSRRQRPMDSIASLYDKIWGRPAECCPKCRNEQTEYYDPFFFAPLRTLAGKRRIKCPSCGFIWRPSRSRRTFFDAFNRQ
ncbi:MAG: hypothetical protein JW863_00010 [Chitinispirillaceae bacterium]|nr:hypothetical protein [Chitinispirillaceae bacterium]